MSSRETYSACKAFLQGSILLSMLASACGGGAGFTSQGSGQDAGGPGDSDGGVVIIISPNMDAQGSVDAVAESVPTEADAGDATVDGPLCSSSDLACGGACVAIDTDNCGACGTKCSAPDGGTPTCTEVNRAYKCDIACSPNLTHCGNACVSVQTDTNNCGRCGHSCLAGACVSGQCQSWLVANTPASEAALGVPRAGTYGHYDMATDGSNVVWIDPDKGVLQVSATAGASVLPVTLSPLQYMSTASPANLAMANEVVVWTMLDVNNGISLWGATEGGKNSGGMIASVGSTANTTNGDLPSGLALDANASNAYFIDSENVQGPSNQSPALYKCSLARKSCAVLYGVDFPGAFLLPNDVAVTMAGDRLFWTDSAQGTISRADYTTSAPVGPVVSNQNGPCLLALDSTNVYWENVVPGIDGGAPSFSIASTPQASPGVVKSVVSSMSGAPQDLRTDGTNLYFELGGDLEYVPVNGSAPPQPLKAGQQVYAIAVGGGAIYWLNADNTINGIAAP